MRRHRPIGAVDLGIVNEALLTPLFKLSGTSNLGMPPKKRNNPHMRPGPVELLRPGRLRIRQVRGAEHGDGNLRLADFASGGIGDPYRFARIIDERLVTRDMMLAAITGVSRRSNPRSRSQNRL